jgi:phage-related protein
MTIEELQILITAKTEGLRKELNKVKQRMGETSREVGKITSSMSSAFKGLAATIATLGIGAVFRSAAKDAMLYESSLQQINRMMGEHAKTFVEWSNTQASAFGLARSEAVRYGATYANLISGFSKTTEETTRRTQDLLKASTVVASATGRELQDVMERIRSGLLGETDAIEDLGINVNVAMLESTKAFQQFANGKSWQQLSFQAQQTILYYGILEQAAKKYGNELAQNTATSQAMFIAQLKDAKLALGQAFLPIYNLVLPALTRMAAALATAMRYIAAFSQALFGGGQTQQTKATDAQAASVGGLGDAYEKAGKQAKGAVAGFDEVNELADAGGGAGEGSAPALGFEGLDASVLGGTADAIDNVSSKAEEMANKVRAAFQGLLSEIASIGQTISPYLQPILDAKEPIKQSFMEIGDSARTLNDNFLKPAANYILSEFVPAIAGSFLNSFVPVFTGQAIWSVQEFARVFKNQTQALSDLWTGTWLPNLDKLKTAFVEAFPKIGRTVDDLLKGSIQPFSRQLNDFIVDISDQMARTLVPVFADVGVLAITEFINTFRWAGNMVNNIYSTIIKPVFDLIKDIVTDTLKIVSELWDRHGSNLLKNLSATVQGVLDLFQKLWDDILEPIIRPFLEMLSWLWDKHLKDLVAQIGDFILRLINGALEIFNEFILPIIGWLVDKLGPTFAEVFHFILDVVGSVIGAIADVIKGLIKILGGIIDFLVGVFTLDWKKAWEGIKDIFGGIWDVIVGVLKGALNIMIDLINVFIRFWNNIKLDVPKIDMGPLGSFGGFTIGVPKLPEIPKLAKGGITNGPMLSWIGDNPGGREVVSPLSDLKAMIASAVGNAFMAAAQMSGFGSQQQESGNGSGDIVINVDGTTIARVTYPYYQREQQRRGSAAIVQI